ncbi:Lipase, GDSL [Cynara cardunculus var. scolymus]|uniref:Lipase, GDSL n=1 Tax=Cynara cardunculus var. scolymus TaxID=59895 RepID=A0A103YF54_CYNCS|nr:Lipase, GDSL [Cynara cardunculus var. scolymus]
MEKEKMEYFSGILTSVLLLVLCVVVTADDPLVPALCFFGDSVMDAGNNNYLTTLLRADFLPYGRDFVTHKPTGRFCNGKLAADYTAEYLGFSTYPPPYLSRADVTTLLTGANFASAGSAISLPRQLSYYKDWQSRVVTMVGSDKANTIFSGGIHILSAGSSDFLQNYYVNPFLNRLYTPAQFSNLLMKSYYSFVQNLYRLGVRRIGVTSLPPAGCLPAAITIFGFGKNKCMRELNDDAVLFNNKLNATSHKLVKKYPDLKLVVFDIYQPLLEMIIKPTDKGT